MSYSVPNWQDSPSTSTPISAANLNTLSNAINDLDTRAVVSVKSYGATGNGITDDTTAIQNALNANRAVYLPNGTYKVTSTLSIPNASQNNFSMIGQSLIGTRINYTGTGACFKADTNATPSNSTRRQYWNLARLYITGPGSGVAGTIGLHLNNALSGSIYDCYVTSFETGVKFDGLSLANGAACYYNSAFNLQVSGCITCVVFAGNANSNQMFGGTIGNATTGVSIPAANNVSLHGVDIESNSSVGANIAGYGNQFLGCRFENTGSALGEIKFDDSGGGTNGTKNLIASYFSAQDPSSVITWDAARNNTVIWPGEVNIGDCTGVTSPNVLKATRSIAADGLPFIEIEDDYSSSGRPIGLRYRAKRWGQPLLMQEYASGNWYDLFAFENVSGSGNPRIRMGWGLDASTLNQIQVGSGSPNSSITGRVGDIYMRWDGGTGQALYVKESGTDTNTGWSSIGSNTPTYAAGGQWDPNVYGTITENAAIDDVTSTYLMVTGSRTLLMLLGLCPANTYSSFKLYVTAAAASSTLTAALYSSSTLTNTSWARLGAGNITPAVTATGLVSTAISFTLSSPAYVVAELVLTTATNFPTFAASGAGTAGLLNPSSGCLVAANLNASTAPAATLNPTTGFTNMTQKVWCALA